MVHTVVIATHGDLGYVMSLLHILTLLVVEWQRKYATSASAVVVCVVEIVLLAKVIIFDYWISNEMFEKNKCTFRWISYL